MQEIITLNGKKYIEYVEEKKEYKRWRATVNCDFYYIEFGEIKTTYDFLTAYDNYKYSVGNYFQTDYQAIKARDKQLAIVRVNDRIIELNEGWEVDWNKGQEKWYIMYNNDKKLFESGYNTYWNKGTLLSKIKSEEIADKIIKEHEEDLKLIFDI